MCVCVINAQTTYRTVVCHIIKLQRKNCHGFSFKGKLMAPLRNRKKLTPIPSPSNAMIRYLCLPNATNHSLANLQ